MKHYVLLVLAIFPLFFANKGHAVRVNSIYQASLPVVSQSIEERNQVLQAALAQVIVKVNGNSRVLNDPAMNGRLKEAGTLMQQFSYSSSQRSDKPYTLVVQFDPKGVDTLLRDVSLPIWGMNRPLILVLAEYEIPGHPSELIGGDSQSNVQEIIQQHAEERGLPVIFPLLDMADINQVSPNDIEQVNIPVLLNAAKRYAGDAMLITRVKQMPDSYSVQAKLVLNENQWNWTVTEKTLPETLNMLINNVTETLAGRYAAVVSNAVQEQLKLRVTGISQQNAFSELMRYLEHVPAVADVEVVEVSGSDVELNISLRGSRESFLHVISIGNRLAPVTGKSDEDNLVYQWKN